MQQTRRAEGVTAGSRRHIALPRLARVRQTDRTAWHGTLRRVCALEVAGCRARPHEFVPDTRRVSILGLAAVHSWHVWICAGSAQCSDHALVVLARRENERGEAGVRVFRLSVRPSLQQRFDAYRLPLERCPEESGPAAFFRSVGVRPSIKQSLND